MTITLPQFRVTCEVFFFFIYFMGVNAHNIIDYGGVMAWNILTCSFLLTYFTTLFKTAWPRSVLFHTSA